MYRRSQGYRKEIKYKCGTPGICWCYPRFRECFILSLKKGTKPCRQLLISQFNENHNGALVWWDFDGCLPNNAVMPQSLITLIVLVLLLSTSDAGYFGGLFWQSGVRSRTGRVQSALVCITIVDPIMSTIDLCGITVLFNVFLSTNKHQNLTRLQQFVTPVFHFLQLFWCKTICFIWHCGRINSGLISCCLMPNYDVESLWFLGSLHQQFLL